MTSFRLTPARRDLLAAVGRGEVTWFAGWRLAADRSIRLSPGEAQRVVTGAMDKMERAGLVRRDPPGLSVMHPRPWRLTPAGASLLSEDES